MNGQIMRGQRGSAGEFGHLSRNSRGERCRCGNRGCLEASIGIPNLLARMSERRGRILSHTDVVRLVREGDEGCSSIIAAAGREAGRALGTLANALDPQLIPVGGAMLDMGQILLDAIGTGFRISALPMHAGIPIHPAELGRSASALGATGLVLASFDVLLSAKQKPRLPRGVHLNTAR